MRRAAAALLLVSVALCGPHAPAAAGDPPPAAANPLRGSDLPTLLKKAAELEAKDVRALGAALTALGDPIPNRGPDLDFLVEYTTRPAARPLRTLALESVRRIDPAAAATAYLEKAKTEKDPTRASLALECLGWVGGKEHSAALIEFVKSPSELVAVAAAEAFAHFGGTQKELDAFIDAGLVHENSHVTDHTAWAVQDLAKKPKQALAPYEKIAAKKSDPRAVRAESVKALLDDKLADPQVWTPPFEAARKALVAAPASIHVQAASPELKASLEASLAWLREKLPAQYWQLCASAKSVRSPGKSSDSRPDFDDLAIDIRPMDAALKPAQIAYHLVRLSTVLWRKQIGEPWKGHRGWEPAIFDTYDVCVIGKMYDAGPSGTSRDRFIAARVGEKPWGGL